GVRFYRDSQQQLIRADGVRRANGATDYEFYQYDSSGQRCSKLSSRIADGITQARRRETVTYISGMRLCEYDYDGKSQGSHYSLSFPLAGHSAVVCLSEREPEKKAIPLSLMRYNCLDAQGSVALELSAEGDIITQEEYYPFGGTSLFSSRSESEADYKYHRYSNKERDNLTGLYDYGFRYYAPWLCRWISPDPLGIADGMNAYCMVHNNPVTYRDSAGLIAAGTGAEEFEMREMLIPSTQRSMAPAVYRATTEPLPQKSIGDRLRSAGRVLSRPLTAFAQGIARIGRAIRRVISGIRSALQRFRGTGEGADLEMQPLLAEEISDPSGETETSFVSRKTNEGDIINNPLVKKPEYMKDEVDNWRIRIDKSVLMDSEGYVNPDEFARLGLVEREINRNQYIEPEEDPDYKDHPLFAELKQNLQVIFDNDAETSDFDEFTHDSTPLLSGMNNAVTPAAISSLALSAMIFGLLWWYQSQHTYRR
ncbi:RHS repeat domain-containing protein, partial [Morganella morganii]|nr:RHS repeat-associated core domain-containing protein [Morganella morganii]